MISENSNRDENTRASSASGAPQPGGATCEHPQLDFLSSPQKRDEIGRLGDYRVLEVLGKGGMAMVLKAQDLKLDRMVALKVMLPSVSVKETARTFSIGTAEQAS